MGTCAQAIHNKQQVKHVSRALTMWYEPRLIPKSVEHVSNHQPLSLAEAMNLIRLCRQGRRSGPSAPAWKPHICHPPPCNCSQLSYYILKIILSPFSLMTPRQDKWERESGRQIRSQQGAMCPLRISTSSRGMNTAPVDQPQGGTWPTAMQRLKLVGPMYAKTMLINR